MKNLRIYSTKFCTIWNTHIIVEMDPSKQLPKLKITSDIGESANKILDEDLHGNEVIPEITDKVYAMGNATAIKSGIEQKRLNVTEKINLQMETGERKKVEGLDGKT